MMVRALGFVALLLATGLAGQAQAQVDLSARVSVSLDHVRPETLFRTVATLNRFQWTVDPALQKPVSITLEDVTLGTLLAAACDSIGCRWRVEGMRLVVEALPSDPTRGKTWFEPRGRVMPAGSRFSNTPAQAVLDSIAGVVGSSVECEIQEVDHRQSVTVDVSNQDPVRAMVTVARAAGIKPGSPLTITLRRPGQKPTIIKTAVPQTR